MLSELRNVAGLAPCTSGDSRRAGLMSISPRICRSPSMTPFIQFTSAVALASAA